MLGALSLHAVMVMGSTYAVLASASQDVDMINLASESGCVACHTVAPAGKSPDGLKPVGPAWQDVAEKYKGVKGARVSLVNTVLKGSNPYSSHWKGEVSGIAMPPNAVAITEEKANRLVGWILHLAD